MAFRGPTRLGGAAPTTSVPPELTEAARPLPHRAKDGPRFEIALFDIGMKIGRLPEEKAARIREIVEGLMDDLADLERDVHRLADPQWHSSRKPPGGRPRVFMRSEINQVGTFRTVLALEGRGVDDFVYDPRTHAGDNRPIDEVFRIPKAGELLREEGSGDAGLRSDLVTLIMAAHRRAWTHVRAHLDLIVVDEPIAVEQPDGSRGIDIDLRSALDAEEATARAAAEHARAEAVLSAFENTFPAMKPETFSEIYRYGQARKRKSAVIAAALAEAGAPSNDTGNVSAGMKQGSRKFAYSASDLSGAAKQLEAALDLVRPHWREPAETTSTMAVTPGGR